MVPVIRDAGRLPSTSSSPPTTHWSRRRAPTRSDGRRPRRRERHAHQPRRPRHGRVGAATDARPGHDRRDRLDRVSRRDSRIGEQIGAEKVLTLTSTYDHRIIQGAESGRFLARIEALLAARTPFTRTSSRRSA
jgi:hypothetical protein